MKPRCNNCDEPINGHPFDLDGRLFCCPGCAAGGPCVCTYETDEISEPDETSESYGPTDAPPAGAGPPTPARPAIVRAGRFASQPEMLRFALEIERLPFVEAVALVRGDPGDAWLAVTLRSPAESVDMLTAALEAFPGFGVSVRPSMISLEATLEHTTGLDEPSAAPETPDLLPPRQRFRLRREPERAGNAGAETETGAMGPRAPTPQPSTVDVVGPDARPGGGAPLREHLTLMVQPFHSFVALNAFCEAVAALHGVIDARVRRFYKGTLVLAVEYEGVIPLAQRLHDMEGFPFEIVSEGDAQVQLRLIERGQAPPAEPGG